MRFPARSVVLLLPLLLTACSHFPFHKEKQPPARQTAPPVQEAPPKPVTPPAEPLPPPVSVPKPVVVIDQDAQKPKKPKASHKKQAEKPVEQAANETPDAGAAAASSVSAIGQLSSGEPSELFRKTSDSITATERGLNGVNRTLSDAEKKTAEHIRDFIKQARVALAAGDVDGASILAAKAKVLLAELSQ